MEYFFNKVKQVMKENYEPIHDDVLRAKVRTTGIMERTYDINDAFISIYDVGGQRNERKKWIHCFTGVTAVIYVAALNHYKQVLFEDEERNAMHESLDLFANLCSSKWFRTVPMILFLNKDDLFKESLRDGISLSCCFNIEVQIFDNCYRQALEFVRIQYVKCDVRNNDNNSDQKPICRIFPVSFFFFFF
ncbi:guanine nucleotide-binding protein G(k) subunit alpha [Reticulomyxa filosa]|uniref:Guanine nucleotide-binding protein G(K) subunit alpha n=1 Tax=Reticulomyxa filosa TaxID=46433 RepID=X6N369_RETFI|nr:guanine nucleotide-binding protein G(k) subunit alpha [Reticulomyxa filosa]|eukprot:ETO19757.1 guanine nucleotide-binding protein G(k) subunit alpha [Reticulomyxa filosa]